MRKTQSERDAEWFERGYVCAAAEIIRLHGEDVVAKDVLRGIQPINWSKIDECDRDAPKDVRADMKREDELWKTRNHRKK